MSWVIGYVALAVAGFAVLAAAGWRLWGNVRELSHTVSAASQRISAALAELQEATAPGGTARRDRGKHGP